MKNSEWWVIKYRGKYLINTIAKTRKECVMIYYNGDYPNRRYLDIQCVFPVKIKVEEI